MSVTKREFSVLSSDGIHALSGVVFFPEGDVKGYFHIVHGMTEYIGRYERAMEDIARAGYICFGYDHLGHGKTACSDEELGYIAKNNGWDILTKDVKVFSDSVIKEFPYDAPYILMGHSMGSFIVRLAAEKYVSPDKLIIMGTGGANPAADIGLALIGLTKFFKGERHISRFIDSVAFGSYNNRFKEEKDNLSWLTNDKEVREKYRNDKFCSFKFTVSAMGDLVRLMKYSNRKAWYKNICRDMPILLVSGEDDPVGNYSRGVSLVRDKLKKVGNNVECILYRGARHEILNDFTYDDAMRDILAFCND